MRRSLGFSVGSDCHAAIAFPLRARQTSNSVLSLQPMMIWLRDQMGSSSDGDIQATEEPEGGSCCAARAPRPHRGTDERSNTDAPDQDAPAQTAHGTLETLGCTHTTHLPRLFFLLPTNKLRSQQTIQRLWGSFCSFVEASKWLQLSPGGAPGIPKICTAPALRARRGKSTLRVPDSDSALPGFCFIRGEGGVT